MQVDTALLTRRLVIRRFREGDGNAIYELFRDNKEFILDYFPTDYKELEEREGAPAYVRKKIAAWYLREAYCFGIWDNDSADLVAYVHLNDIDWHVPKSELRFFVDHEYSGKGLMTEALVSIIEFAFDQLKIQKLSLRTAADNFAVQRVARKCGFIREGDLRAEWRRRSGDLDDLILFGLTRKEVRY